MLISVYNSARDGCQCYKAMRESTEPFMCIWLRTSARLLCVAGCVLTSKTKDVQHEY